MARTVRNGKLDSRSARSKLEQRREPYWTVISTGCALGYRRGSKGGTWVARMRDETGKQHYEALGAADDARDPDGLTVFSFSQAQETARKFFRQKGRVLSGHADEQDGPYSIADAVADYFIARERRGSKGTRQDRYVAEARIIPELGSIELSKLTARRIRDWQTALSSSAKLVRSKRNATKRATRETANDPEAVRARRATSNRQLTILKAALNHAFHEGRIASDEAWRKVKPHREVDAARVQFLSASECVRLVNACEGAVSDLVRGALVTGCRYGELTRMKVSDYSPESGMVTVRLSKAGKSRHVALNDEGRSLFTTLTAGRSSRELIFARDDGKPWGVSHQKRPLEEASARAKLDPPATFHILRHTYGSALAMKGVPMGVIAAQLGHADTRMTERHYAHLAPSYIADTIRAALPGFGIVVPSNLVPLAS
ncbi:MAG: tyrosine-type recombinase/integrase [Beijerinckiaceae bacterium]